MKTTSRFALVAAAGLLLGAAMTPAKAADLGGGCCADLEERVAELEATTARKGNRVVSLQVYGQVNKALMIYDNGVDADALIVDKYDSGSRVGLTGKAKINAGLTAGYLIEFDMADASSALVTHKKDGDEEGSVFVLRHNNWYIESERLGRITVGLGSTAADGANEVVLANSLTSANIQVGNKIGLTDGTNYITDNLGARANNLDGNRRELIRYDSPSVYGFIMSATWGDNDYTDVALRFKKEFSTVRLAAAVAYQWDTSVDNTATKDKEFTTLSGSVSAMHVPTGIYAAFAAGDRDHEDDADYDQSFWYIQAGIEKKFMPYGTTTIYGEYGQYTKDGDSNDVESNRLGFGVVQKIDAAAMDIYAQATFWDFDNEGTSDDPDDLTTVMIGSRIKF